MRLIWKLGPLLICALALSSCASNGAFVKPPEVAPPRLPAIPASLTQRTNYVQQVQDELFESSPPAKPSATPY